MSHTPVFSIITVSLNNLDGLQKTANSLQNQALRDFEWIVIDGDSDDGTKKWLKSTEAYWVSEPDHGLYHAMNKGIDRACGMFLLFLNAGDTLTGPETLLEIAAYIGERDLVPDFIYGDSYEKTEHDRNLYKPSRPYKKRKYGMFTQHQSMIYRREALKNLRYSTNYNIAADYDLTCRFLENTDQVLYWPQAVCIFESGGISQQNAVLGRKEQFQIRKTLGLVPFSLNALLYLLQSLIWTVRTLSPGLYWGVRSSGNRPSASLQT